MWMQIKCEKENCIIAKYFCMLEEMNEMNGMEKLWEGRWARLEHEKEVVRELHHFWPKKKKKKKPKNIDFMFKLYFIILFDQFRERN